ncbi:hypothetical protein RHDC4_02803 [Rhodocyclaceae bacterium]|nr:hypothetical protein RHDC4_02803 [Rhodocyclaceae bacterium]
MRATIPLTAEQADDMVIAEGVEVRAMICHNFPRCRLVAA